MIALPRQSCKRYMLIDTHAHINFNAFREDADEVIRRALDKNIQIIIVGADYKTSKRALVYANKYEKGVYAAAGLHPLHIFSFRAQSDDYDFRTRGEEFNYDGYDQLARFEKTAAVGEIGLDYYHLEGWPDIAAVKKKQQAVFREQLCLARRRDKAAIIHCRQAHDDMLSLLRGFRKENKELFPAGRPWGVMHCFSGDEDLAWKYFSLGLLISFTGLITFSGQWDDLIRKLPLEKFLVETDSPFMTPAPFRGRRNEPLFVQQVARRIADIKGLPAEKVAKATTENARWLFRI